MRTVMMTLAVLALAGCGAQQKSADRSATPTSGGATASDAVVASGPRMIEELTNQRQVFECPRCGMDYDAAGVCSMDSTTLVATRVDYTCPADGKPVEQAGHCPRCAMNARVEKTAMAVAPATGKN